MKIAIEEDILIEHNEKALVKMTQDYQAGSKEPKKKNSLCKEKRKKFIIGKIVLRLIFFNKSEKIKYFDFFHTKLMFYITCKYILM